MGRYLLTVADLARVLGKSRAQTAHIVRTGGLPFAPVEGLPVKQFRRVDVENWLGCPIDDPDPAAVVATAGTTPSQDVAAPAVASRATARKTTRPSGRNPLGRSTRATA